MATEKINVEIDARYDDAGAKQARKDLTEIDAAEASAEITADDNASRDIDRVDGKLDGLDGRTAEATLDTDDNATADVDRLDGKLDGVDGRTAEATLDTDDNASGDVDRLDGKLDGIDGRTVKATVDATTGTGLTAAERALDDADGRTTHATVDASTGTGLTAAERALDDADGRTTHATVDASTGTGLTAAETALDDADGRTTHATVDATTGTGLTNATKLLDDADGRTTHATVDASATTNATNLFGRIGGLAGGVKGVGTELYTLAAVGGPIAAVGAAFLGAADQASELATEAATIAELSGTSTENASALSAVLRDNTNIEAGDLMDIMAQVTGALASNPSLMSNLGISMDTVRQGPFATFIAAVDAWNSGQLTGTEKMLAGAQLFGEEGLRQIAGLTTALDTTLADAVAGISENRLIHPEDVAAAQELKRQTAQLVADFQAMAVNIGQEVVPVMADMLGQLEAAGGLVNDIASIGQEGTARSVWDFINQFPSAKFTEIYDALNAAGVSAEDFRNNVFDLADVMALLEAGIPADVIDDAELSAEAQQYLAEQIAATADVATDVAPQYELAGLTQQDYAAAIQVSIDALNEQLEAQKEAAAQSEEQADALLAANDVYYAHEKAVRDARDAVDKYNDVAADAEATADDQADALQDVAEAAQDVADTEVDAARRTKEATGATLTNTEALDIQNDSLLAQAGTLQGPTRDALIDHIARLNGIPPEVVSQILALIDQGKIDEAEQLLNSTSRTRESTVRADADNASVHQTEKDLDYLARDRHARIVADIFRGFTASGLGNLFGGGRSAESAPPPAVVQPVSAAGGGDVYNLNLPRGTRVTDTVRALDRHARRNGRRPYAFRR